MRSIVAPSTSVPPGFGAILPVDVVSNSSVPAIFYVPVADETPVPAGASPVEMTHRLLFLRLLRTRILW